MTEISMQMSDDYSFGNDEGLDLVRLEDEKGYCYTRLNIQRGNCKHLTSQATDRLQKAVQDANNRWMCENLAVSKMSVEKRMCR